VQTEPVGAGPCARRVSAEEVGVDSGVVRAVEVEAGVVEPVDVQADDGDALGVADAEAAVRPVGRVGGRADLDQRAVGVAGLGLAVDRDGVVGDGRQVGSDGDRVDARPGDVEADLDGIVGGSGVGVEDGLAEGAGAGVGRVGDGKDPRINSCRVCRGVATNSTESPRDLRQLLIRQS